MKFGSNNINAVKLGSSTVDKIYVGSTQVWPNEGQLQISLDAANYSGSGTSWPDGSGEGNNATLVNAPTFSTTNMGLILIFHQFKHFFPQKVIVL